MSDNCGDSCASKVPVVDPQYRRILVIALLVNLAMFIVELIAGSAAGSSALLADALDFLGDAANYGISLYVLGHALVWRARASLLKGATMGVFGLWVLYATVERLLAGQVPEASTMGVVGFLALLSNVGVAWMLFHYRTGDSNMQSVWICSRNDAIGNIAVMCAAGGVWLTASAWPDVVVALGMAMLAISGSVQIVRAALHELREEKGIA
ncbi:cation transporter [Perlucidibaca piscinae]|uniref:cation transporter n=1 Tax=Perlucidibaca piscinae TaxID=392589 RepID=UPI0003B40B1A|nr:cation diffusion facilitator family transporter [Perlucidibaca piscinae]